MTQFHADRSSATEASLSRLNEAQRGVIHDLSTCFDFHAVNRYFHALDFHAAVHKLADFARSDPNGAFEVLSVSAGGISRREAATFGSLLAGAALMQPREPGNKDFRIFAETHDAILATFLAVRQAAPTLESICCGVIENVLKGGPASASTVIRAVEDLAAMKARSARELFPQMLRCEHFMTPSIYSALELAYGAVDETTRHEMRAAAAEVSAPKPPPSGLAKLREWLLSGETLQSREMRRRHAEHMRGDA